MQYESQQIYYSFNGTLVPRRRQVLVGNATMFHNLGVDLNAEVLPQGAALLASVTAV